MGFGPQLPPGWTLSKLSRATFFQMVKDGALDLSDFSSFVYWCTVSNMMNRPLHEYMPCSLEDMGYLMTDAQYTPKLASPVKVLALYRKWLTAKEDSHAQLSQGGNAGERGAVPMSRADPAGEHGVHG